MLPPLVVWAIGLLAGDLAALHPLPVVAMVAIAGVAILSSAATRSKWTRDIVIASLAAALGYSNADLVYRPVLPDDHIANLPLPATVRLQGHLVLDPELRGQQTRLVIEVNARLVGERWVPASGLVAITVRDLETAWGSSDELRATVTLRRPRNFGNPGEFDYQAYLARQLVYVTGYADRASLELVEGGRGWASAMSRWRAATRAGFRAGLPTAEAQLLDALILGTQRELPLSLQDAFRRTGTSHILAISGLNVGLVATGAYATIRWLLGRSRWLLLAGNVPKLATLLSLLPVLLYAGIAGTNLATSRALVMLVVVLGALLLDRQQRAAISLAAAVAVILSIWPGSACDPSFQLSFAAVAGLVFGMQRFSTWWRQYDERRLLRLLGWRGRAERAVVTFVAVSGMAMAATMPLVIFHFNQISLVALIANAVAVPLLGSIAVGLGLFAAVGALIAAPLSQACAALAFPALWAGRQAVELFAAVPYAATKVVSLSVLELTLCYLALSSTFWLDRRFGRLLLSAVLVIATCDGGYWWWHRHHRSDLSVTFLSVGQGDCAVVEMPGGQVMVIDGGGLTGGGFDVGERIVAPFLWSRKIGRLDYVVVSHPEWDHYGGLRYLVENFAPRELWWNGSDRQVRTFEELLASARQQGTEIVELRRGARRSLNGVEVVALAPERPDGVSLNDGSLVLSLDYRQRRVLFTGDIEAGGEETVMRSAGDQLRSAVLKVPHHGSRTSSTPRFLAAVEPRVAVISAGFANRFGFPNPAVMRRYAALGTRLWRTDVDGAVEVRVSRDGSLATTGQTSPG